jgi:hypothetical protein
MLRSTLFLALLMGASAVHAETNMCTTIGSLPYAITTPGAYCLQSNLSITNAFPSGTWSINISANDVILDCNEHSITGPTPDSSGQTALNVNGIRVESNQRTTVRNCRINGFDKAIRLNQSLAQTATIPSDVIIEDNKIAGSIIPIGGTPKGVNRIRRNTIHNGPGAGIAVAVVDGVVEINDNFISHIGDVNVFQNWGTGLELFTSGTNAFAAAHDNIIAEIVAAPGPANAGAVILDYGTQGVFEGNIVSAPSNPANQAQVHYGVQEWAGPGTTSVACHDNTILGYGGEGNNSPCLAANNTIVP